MSPSDLEHLIAELLLFLQESAAYAKGREQQELGGTLDLAIRQLLRIHARMQRVRERYVVAVVGLSNVGKSSLINALLGEHIAPRRNGPCTACPVEFAAGQAYRMTAYFRGDFRTKVEQADSANDLQSMLAHYVDRPASDAERACSRVVVELDHELLRQGLVLADTPGFGAAQIGESADAHEQSVRAYMAESVAQVFWVVLGEQGIGQTERRFHENWLADLCDDVVVTGGDDWDNRDRQRFRQRYRPLFQDRVPAFHFVGRASESEVEPIADRVRALQETSGRLEAVKVAVHELATQLGDWLGSWTANQHSSKSRRWRPDSWGRLRHAPACDGLRDSVISLWGA